MNYITFTHNGKKYATTFKPISSDFWEITSGELSGNSIPVIDCKVVYGIPVKSEQHFIDFINFNPKLHAGTFFTYHFIDNVAIIISTSRYTIEVIFEAYKNLYI